MKAVVLAAGYATRLYPLTQNTPKCLLKVGGQTILDTIVGKICGLRDVDEVILVTNAKFFEQLNNWQKGLGPGLPVRVLNDQTTSNETRLGAIGDLDLAIRQAQVGDDVLLLASDNLFDEELGGFFSFARSKKDAISIAVYDIGDPRLAAKKFGVIEADRSGRVTGIEEKPEHPKSSLIGMGVYYFPKESLGLVREYLSNRRAQDAPGHYIRWLFDRGIEIFCFRFQGMWYDIGDLKALEEANSIFNKGFKKRSGQ